MMFFPFANLFPYKEINEYHCLDFLHTNSAVHNVQFYSLQAQTSQSVLLDTRVHTLEAEGFQGWLRTATCRKEIYSNFTAKGSAERVMVVKCVLVRRRLPTTHSHSFLHFTDFLCSCVLSVLDKNGKL